jgi:ketosteroid isomerase-like protein
LIFHVSDIIIEGDRACVVWSNKGEHKDGTLYENQGITLVHFLENQIVFLSDYFKDTSFANNS